MRSNNDGDAFSACILFFTGIVTAAVLCAYMWLEPAMECEKYKQIVSEQQAVIERYKVQTDTMMQVIDELSKEGGE